MGAANTTPIFTKAPNGSGVRVTAANTRSDGDGTIGTDIFLAFTAGANGARVDRIEWMPTATVAGTSTTGTVGRIFVSTLATGSTTSSNTRLLREVQLTSVSAANSSTLVVPIVVPGPFYLEPGETILVTNHAAPASNTAWVCNVHGGDY